MKMQATKAMAYIDRLYGRGKKSFDKLTKEEKTELVIALMTDGHSIEVTKSLKTLALYLMTSDRDYLIRYAEDSLSELSEQCEDKINELFDFVDQIFMSEEKQRAANAYDYYESLYKLSSN